MSNVTINNSVILVIGGTGSWGHELVSQIIENYNPKEVRIYSRGEHKQVEMSREFNYHPKLKFIIGDVRDKNVLNNAMKNVDIVFHLAALKHVPVCEENSWEAVLTNIIGTQNVIESAIANNIKKVVDVSTDKAVEPFNLYGVTKACGEKLMINSNFYFSGGNNGTSFIAIRGGNVIGTNGSVIPLFKKQLKEKNEITITDPLMTRFLMSTKEAIKLIFTAVENSIGGELFVLRMPGTTVQNISEVMIKLFGNKDSKIKNIGIRPGEKMDEILVSKNESAFTYEFSKDYFVILPQIKNQKLLERYKDFKKINVEEFNSKNTHQLPKEELELILRKEKWIWDDNINLLL